MTKEETATQLDQEIRAVASEARRASRLIAKASAEQRSRALGRIAEEILSRRAAILEANASDLSAAEQRGLSEPMVDRLRLDDSRLGEIANAVEEVAGLPDIVGRIESTITRPNGIEVSKMRIPLGVVAIIYESRPNVTSDAAALCLKSGNATILRGGSEAFHSNRSLGEAVTAGLEAADLPGSAVQVIGSTDRQAMVSLLQCDEHVDLVIPRGGEGLIRFVAEHSRIPVLKHFKGVCHLYVHAEADQNMALSIAENGKVQRPGVCNAIETILVDAAIAGTFVPRLAKRFGELDVEIRGDERVQELVGEGAFPAAESDWHEEYLAKIVAIRVVPGYEAAVDHIEQFGSDHTESIITNDKQVAERFVREVSSSTVMVNASTRFADGGELGLGAEIGISTTKLHAYGPMGVEGLTTTKFVVMGQGQVRT